MPALLVVLFAPILVVGLLLLGLVTLGVLAYERTFRRKPPVAAPMAYNPAFEQLGVQHPIS